MEFINMKQTKKIWYAPYKFEAYGQEEIDAVVESLDDKTVAVTDEPRFI